MRDTIVMLAILAAGATGCAGTEHIEDYDCPSEGTPLTYESFGKGFINGYCQPCHGSSVDDRRGAPPNYTFDDYDQVLELKDRVFARAAAGNDSMPPGPDDPSEAEREQLAEWLACGTE